MKWINDELVYCHTHEKVGKITDAENNMILFKGESEPLEVDPNDCEDPTEDQLGLYNENTTAETTEEEILENAEIGAAGERLDGPEMPGDLREEL